MAEDLAFIDAITLEELEADPYPAWEKLRRSAPVAFVPAIGAWCVTSFEYCALVGSGDAGFEGAKDHPTLTRVFGMPNVLAAEGDTHKQIRIGVDPRLQPRPVNQIVEAVVRPIARRYLAAIGARGQGELMSAYFEPVSVEALRHVMGLDDIVDADTLRGWFRDLNLGASNFALDAEIFATADRAGADIERLVGPKLAYLAQHPDDSMLSHMLWTGRKPEEGPRSLEMIWPSLKVILLGGMQEPGHAAGSTLHGLFSRPDQWAKLLADPGEWIPHAINEGLRWIAPIGAVERQAMRDVELGGYTIPEGSIVQVILASANRDEKHFPNPDIFDMERASNPHQAFGHGVHFCAGHFFARHVERIMFEELVAHLPNLRPPPEYQPKIDGWVFRAPKVFQCLWDPVNVPLLDAAEPQQPPLFPPDEAAETLTLQVKAIAKEADDVVSLELGHPDERPLPAWTPGAHVDLWLSDGRAAQYSLCGDRTRPDRWTVAVKREANSRGISRYIHDTLRPGAFIAVGFPRNHFDLHNAPGYTFIAGGIGVTPLLPMMEWAKAKGADFQVVYCGRRRTAMAFADRVQKLAGAAALVCRDVSDRPDLRAIIKAAADRGHLVYACGPASMIDAALALGQELGVATYSERFEGGEALREGDFAFDVTLANSGISLTVPADRTLLQVLEENGYHVRRSCQEGNCGTCEAAVLAGRIDHRDVLLTERQRATMDRMMVCVSRAASPDERIVLDL